MTLLQTSVNKPRTPASAALQAALCAAVCMFASTYTQATTAVTQGKWVTADQLNTLIEPGSLPEGSRVEVNLVKQDLRIGAQSCPVALFSNVAGNKLWGRTFLRVQCVGSENPGFFVGVDVKVWAPVLVMKNTVALGQSILPSDVEFKTMDIAQLPTGWVASVEHLNNKTASRPLWPGAVLKQDFMKGQPMVRSGDQVKIMIKGSGFAIGGSAVAIESAEQGEKVKVKTAQGKVLSGVATEPSMVEVEL